MQLGAQTWLVQEDLSGPAAICVTPDQGSLLLHTRTTSLVRQLALTKLDATGRVQWQKIMNTPGSTIGQAMLITRDGYAIVAGSRSQQPNNSDAILLKVRLNGDIIWERTFSFGVTDDVGGLSEQSNGDFVLALQSANQLRLLRTDQDGFELVSEAYPNTSGLTVSGLTLLPDDSRIITLLRSGLPISVPEVQVLRINVAGTAIWRDTLPHYTAYNSTDIARTKVQGNDLLLMHRDSVYRLNANTGQVFQRMHISVPGNFFLTDLQPVDDGGFLACGTTYSVQNQLFNQIWVGRFNATGTQMWQRLLAAPSMQHATWAMTTLPQGVWMLGGNYLKNGKYYSYTLRCNSDGSIASNRLEGRLFWDINDNCIADSNEPPLRNWLLNVSLPDGRVLVASTDALGNYSLETDAPQCTVQPVMPFDTWASDCTPTANITFDTTFETKKQDFPIHHTSDCSLPRVGIGLDYWQPCVENTVSIRCDNPGTVVAEDVRLVITLDSLLLLENATLPVQTLGNNRFSVDIGDVNPLQSIEFQAFIRPVCDPALSDRTLCVTAEIENPDECLTPWNQPLIRATGRCDGDSVRFTVENTRSTAMNETLGFIIIEDNIMCRAGNFQLDALSDTTFVIPRNGATWRIEARQPNGLPLWLGDAITADAVEGCSDVPLFSTGLVNDFSLYDGGIFREKECREVRFPFHEPEKMGYPEGRTNEHLIEKNTDIEYAIHFQNLTGDTAQTIVILDTLDHERLNINSIRETMCSLPYEMSLSDQGVMSIRILNAALPDSARGWVRFRISQQPDLPDGTIILNRAAVTIQFDTIQYSQTTLHRIGQTLFTGVMQPQALSELRIWPQPAFDEIMVNGGENSIDFLLLTDVVGRRFVRHPIQDNTFSVQQLPAGWYSLQAWSKTAIIGIGKLLKH